jgi:hypothetical protein
MSDVDQELAKTNKQIDAHMKSVTPLPLTQIDWQDELYDNYDWPWAEWVTDLFWLMAAVVTISLVIGFIAGYKF